MTSEKIHFSRMSCGDFVLASKMKPKFDSLTPPYFCDIGIFDKVAVTLRIFKQQERMVHNPRPVREIFFLNVRVTAMLSIMPMS